MKLYIQDLVFLDFLTSFPILSVYSQAGLPNSVGPSRLIFKSSGEESFTFRAVPKKAPRWILTGLACVMPFPKPSPWLRGWDFLSDQVYVKYAFWKQGLFHMDEEKEGRGMHSTEEKMQCYFQKKGKCLLGRQK